MADLAQLERALINADKAGDTAAATALAGEIRRMRSQPAANAGAADTPQPKASFLDEVKGGIASAPINLYLGAKQLFGGLSPVEQDVLQQNREAEKAAPVSSFVSNVATLAPAMMIPGANTVAGAALTGAATGAAQPVEGDQSFGDIAKGKLMAAALGGAGGAAGQVIGNKIGSALQTRLADKTAEAAANQSRNAVKDATLAEGRAAGYVVPNSEVAPSFLGNRLESLGGKAAIKQEATARNQGVTNSLARKALGLADDESISQNAIDAVRKKAGAVYEEVGSLSPQAKLDLEALKQARNDAQGWFNAYNRSASPADLEKAKAARALVDQLDASLEAAATSAGRTDLPAALAQARKEIAKSYTVQRALNPATGDVSAPTIGRLFAKGKPLSDGLDTIGSFQAAFPKFAGEGARNPAAGVSKSEMLAAALLGAGGSAITGNPVGMAAAALPMLSHPARAIALSKVLQKTPEYGVGFGTRAAGQLTPERAALIMRGLSQTAVPGMIPLAAE